MMSANWTAIGVFKAEVENEYDHEWEVLKYSKTDCFPVGMWCHPKSHSFARCLEFGKILMISLDLR